uniref:Protein kinase domain-containing protein n=1 Tax=Macrostomum lignano TaxID=282301 RepID=A0A1I8J5U2_9PLAT
MRPPQSAEPVPATMPAAPNQLDQLDSTSAPQQQQPVLLHQRDFEKVRRLGLGKYARVYVCRRAPVNGEQQASEFAMKEVRMNTGCHNEYLMRERDLLILCSESPFIVNLMCTFQEPQRQRAYLILQLGEGGDLYELHEDVHLFNEQDARFYLAEITCGLEFMHERSIIHRDVKGENILLTGAGHVMLCDLGLARRLNGPDDRARTYCGTLSYMSPEMVRRQRYGTKTDIWSNNEDEKQSNIMKGRYHLSCIAKMSYACKSLISNMLKANPDQRPTATELKTRRFLNKLDWTVVASGGLQPPYQPRYGRKCRRGVGLGGIVVDAAGIDAGQQQPDVDATTAEAAHSTVGRGRRKSRADSQFRFHADDDKLRGKQPATAAGEDNDVTSGFGEGKTGAVGGGAEPMEGFDWVSPELLLLPLTVGLSLDDAEDPA